MRLIIWSAVLVIAAVAIFGINGFTTEAEAKDMTLYDFNVKDIDGNDVSLGDYEGKMVIIVNVASKCGYTPQYEGLQKLHEKYSDKGVAILAFPCNQFGAQEPGSNEEIKDFCSVNYGVTFPMFDKVDVNGDNAAPLYVWLKKSVPGTMGTEAIKWNFTKFLVGKDGKVVNRYGSGTTPEELDKIIAGMLN